MTYLQRYTLKAALGLAVSTDDDGRASGNGGTITEDQAAQIKSKIVEAGADLPRFLKTFGIERVEDMAAARFNEAIRLLNVKIAKGAPA